MAKVGSPLMDITIDGDSEGIEEVDNLSTNRPKCHVCVLQSCEDQPRPNFKPKESEKPIVDKRLTASETLFHITDSNHDGKVIALLLTATLTSTLKHNCDSLPASNCSHALLLWRPCKTHGHKLFITLGLTVTVT